MERVAIGKVGESAWEEWGPTPKLGATEAELRTELGAEFVEGKGDADAGDRCAKAGIASLVPIRLQG